MLILYFFFYSGQDPLVPEVCPCAVVLLFLIGFLKWTSVTSVTVSCRDDGVENLLFTAGLVGFGYTGIDCTGGRFCCYAHRWVPVRTVCNSLIHYSLISLQCTGCLRIVICVVPLSFFSGRPIFIVVNRHIFWCYFFLLGRYCIMFLYRWLFFMDRWSRDCRGFSVTFSMFVSIITEAVQFCVECMFVSQTEHHLSSVDSNRELNLGPVNWGLLCCIGVMFCIYIYQSRKIQVILIH